MILIKMDVFLSGTGMLVCAVKYVCLFLSSERLLEVGNLLRCLFPSIVPPIEIYTELPLVSTLLEQGLPLLMLLKKNFKFHVVYYLVLVDNDDEVTKGRFNVRANPDV